MTTQEPSPSSSIHPAPRPPRRAGPTNKDTPTLMWMQFFIILLVCALCFLIGVAF